MKFNDVDDQTGIVQETRFLTSANSADFTNQDIARGSNLALDNYFDIAMAANSRWDIDDTTYSDYAVSTAALVSGQSDYQFPTNLIEIKAVFAKNSNGDKYMLRPIDQLDADQPLSEMYKTDGEPLYYDKKNGALFLYPAPNYASATGLEIEYTRIANYFLYTDTTKVAGIPNHHHGYLPLFNANRYGMRHTLPNQNKIDKELMKFEQRIEDYWANLGLDDRPVMKVNRISGR